MLSGHSWSSLHSKPAALKEGSFLHFMFYFSSLLLLPQGWAENTQVLCRGEAEQVLQGAQAHQGLLCSQEWRGRQGRA